MPATKNRDLASGELWELSLERSRRRRVLAANARKEQNRRKTASVAVSAAVAAAPMWPSVAGGGSSLAKADAAKGAKQPNGRERVLLSFGDRSPAVVELQHALRILEDGIFGPQTQAAVRAFQKRAGLPATGEVDVRSWLALFPDDAVVVAPGSSGTQGGEPQWAAVSSHGTGDAPVEAASATVSGTAGEPPARSKAEPSAQGRPSARAASSIPIDVPPEDDGSTGSPTNGAVPIPIPPAGAPPVQGSPPPSGGEGAPPGDGAPPAVPVAPKPVVPVAPRGSIDKMIAAMMAEANRIDRARYAYRWGGGHNRSFSGPYDCSGAVSAVLHAGGLLSSPLVSGGFTRWGAPGRGLVTIYANASHVYMSIRGRFFGTSRSNPGGGAGWFRGGPRSGFVVVHVPFEGMKLRNRSTSRQRSTMKKRPARPLRPRGDVRAPRPSPPPIPQRHQGTPAGGTPAGSYQPPPSSSPTTMPTGSPPPPSSGTPAPPVAPGVAPSQPPGGSAGEAPPAQSGPTVTTPAGSVTVTPPTRPGGGGGSSSGERPTSPPPPPAAVDPAPVAAQPSPSPPPSSSGPAQEGGSSGSGEGSTAGQPTNGPPAQTPAGPVDGVVAGAGEAAKPVTSTLTPKAPEPPAAEPGSGASVPGSG